MNYSTSPNKFSHKIILNRFTNKVELESLNYLCFTNTKLKIPPIKFLVMELAFSVYFFL